MNDYRLNGPCADFEFDLVDLHEGSLAGDRARRVREHLQGCPRCRDWLAGFAAIDGALSRALPSLALAADFDLRLQARIEEIARTQSRAQLRADADKEYGRMLDSLGRGVRWRAAGNAVASAAAALCAFGAARSLLSAWLPALPPVGQQDSLVALSFLGIAIAGCTLAWSIRRGLPLLAR
jgi:anti-sigma factor RsiW